MIERLNCTYKAFYRHINGFDNIDSANYDLALWIAYYNFLRPHKHNRCQVLNEVEMLKGADNMPGKWQLLIFLDQQRSCSFKSSRPKALSALRFQARGDIMIGERIKQLRAEAGHTQTELAKKLGLPRSAVNAWEMGISIPSTQYLVELSRLFHVSTDYILGLTKDEKEMLDISFLNHEEKAMLRSMLNQFQKHHDAIDLLQKHNLFLKDD